MDDNNQNGENSNNDKNIDIVDDQGHIVSGNQEISNLPNEVKKELTDEETNYNESGFFQSKHHEVKDISTNNLKEISDNQDKNLQAKLDQSTTTTQHQVHGIPGRKPNKNMTIHTEEIGAINALKDFVNVDETKTNDDTIIDVHVKNPLKRIMKMLEDIKNKQSTTVSLRFTIPLIALPVILLGAFQLGRAQTICSTRFSSTVGNLRKLAVMAPVEKNDSFSILLSFFPSFPRIQKPDGLVYRGKTILISSQGQVIDVIHDPSIKLDIYNGIDVIISGMFSPCTNSITLDSVQNITQKN